MCVSVWMNLPGHVCTVSCWHAFEHEDCFVVLIVGGHHPGLHPRAVHYHSKTGQTTGFTSSVFWHNTSKLASNGIQGTWTLNTFQVGFLLNKPLLNPDSSIGIMTRLSDGRPRSRGSILSMGKRAFSSVKHPDQLWIPPSFLFSGHGD
jgi:hypothetical protein